MASRDSVIDAAKGIAIVAIVFGHVWRGLDAAGLIRDAALFSTVDTAVYMWHLTVFAFTAGLFVQRGMRRETPWKYAIRRDLTFLWLYVLWSLIQGAVKLAAGDAVNSQTSAVQIFELWQPEGQMWFFGWIALMMALTAATQPWRTTRRSIVLLCAVGVLSAAAWGLSGQILGTQGLALTVFFFAGVVWRGDRLLTAVRRVPLWAAFLVGACAAAASLGLSVSGLATPPTIGGSGRSVVSVVLGAVASTAGLVAVLMIARVLARFTPAARAVAYLGRESMAIFVAHIIFASGARILLMRVGVDGLAVQAILGTAVGVAGPLILLWCARRIRWTWLFEAPRWLDRAVPASSREHAKP